MRLQSSRQPGDGYKCRELAVLQGAARQAGATVMRRRRRHVRATAFVKAVARFDDVRMRRRRSRYVLRLEGMQKWRAERAERREQRPQQSDAAERRAAHSREGQPGGVTHRAHA